MALNSEILRTLSYGMYAIGVQGEERVSACIVNTVFQISATPVILAVSVHHDNYTNACIKRTGQFTVSVLSEDTSGAVIGALGFTSGKDVDKLKNINHKVLAEGVPVLKENICCWMLCHVIDQVETATHTVFLAKVVAGSERVKGCPMTYEYYHEVIKGTAPKNAPTHLPQDLSEGDLQNAYVCTICGYRYNDPDMPFEDLPDTWVCPVCSMPKRVFQRRGG